MMSTRLGDVIDSIPDIGAKIVTQKMMSTTTSNILKYTMDLRGGSDDAGDRLRDINSLVHYYGISFVILGIVKATLITDIIQAEVYLQHATDGDNISNSTFFYYGINVPDDNFKIWLKHQLHDEHRSLKLLNVSTTKKLF